LSQCGFRLFISNPSKGFRFWNQFRFREGRGIDDLFSKWLVLPEVSFDKLKLFARNFLGEWFIWPSVIQESFLVKFRNERFEPWVVAKNWLREWNWTKGIDLIDFGMPLIDVEHLVP
jgi:hypothetical protein